MYRRGRALHGREQPEQHSHRDDALPRVYSHNEVVWLYPTPSTARHGAIYHPFTCYPFATGVAMATGGAELGCCI